LAKRLDQAGLANTGLTPDEDETSMPSGGVSQMLLELGKLLVTLEQRHR
jgi:hypothetical protein